MILVDDEEFSSLVLNQRISFKKKIKYISKILSETKDLSYVSDRLARSSAFSSSFSCTNNFRAT